MFLHYTLFLCYLWVIFHLVLIQLKMVVYNMCLFVVLNQGLFPKENFHKFHLIIQFELFYNQQNLTQSRQDFTVYDSLCMALAHSDKENFQVFPFHYH